ncbi:hypothetical protein GKZ90_0014745 [Flavobacterium sp. MC2016-06]|jgi:hypothetical protein|uniref:hypothetical protein n=1 Tax=Flavobacterium sp. MC2016-06 TaxID=2676308 RepID=UPI0012BABE59|nr:hypothetical protein [Flavobacterium sp. MC2016-06]MBU3859278.1 hypothetical protein [Flavobacterium sp. MC2016-06]
MKKYNLIILMFLHFTCFAQNNKIKIKYSIRNEKKIQYREKISHGDTLTGYGPSGKISFKNKSNLKLYFINDKVFLNNQLFYCFENVQYYESLLLIAVNNKEYLYIYPHYYGRIGPYIWYELGVLIEIKPKPIVKENMDYFEDYELNELLKFKKYKIRNLKNKTCDDGSLD